MTDDLDDLKSALTRATPRPDPATRAAHLRLAQENFAALQGSRDATRQTSATGQRGLWTGVKTMLSNLTSKGGLTVTTALVAVGFLVLTPAGQQVWKGPIARDTALGSDRPAVVAQSPMAETAPQDLSTLAAPEPQPPVALDTGRTLSQADTVGATVAPAEMADSNGKSTDMIAASPPVAAARVDRTESNEQDFAAPPPQASLESEAARTRAAPSGALQSLAAPTNMADTTVTPTAPDTEAYANATDNPLKITAEAPVSTFSIDVDTASYALIRNSLTGGVLPPRDAVRIEEMVNYFPYTYPAPGADDAPFRPTVSVMQTPWNPDTQLVSIGIQGRMPDVDSRPPLNLVFLIDTSGSMDDPAKLPLLKQSFRLMLDQLRPTDEVAIVEYAGSAGEVLAPTPASNRKAILNALSSLGAGGSTNGQGGLQQAYQVAEGMAAEGEVNRVILATDGDFNVGLSDPEALKNYIATQRASGTYLSVLGFGRGNLDDATMQALAQNGNGTAAYIDTLAEAQKVLVDQLTGALFPIADDVKIQVEWNPATVAEYRLIGYETRALNREDFNNDRVDAGEIGAGQTVTAIYEVTPVGSPAQLSDPLRYGEAVAVGADNAELGFLKLRYKEPGAATSELLETPITAGSVAGSDAQFAAAIAGFGQLLKGGQYLGTWGYSDAIALATENRGDDAFGYRTEAVQLMRLAQSLSGN